MEWVDVKEGLPNNHLVDGVLVDDEVLFITSRKEMDIGRPYRLPHTNGEQWMGKMSTLYTNVTHWMVKPKLPESIEKGV